jgi:hypothetical protein
MYSSSLEYDRDDANKTDPLDSPLSSKFVGKLRHKEATDDAPSREKAVYS